MVTVGALNLIYQFWVHTEHVGELGWFEYVFVSPSNHRVHHARNPCYLDRNYGGVFIVWDRFFGSYQREQAAEPCVYGITTPIRSWSPWEAWVHVYRDMLSDMWRTTSWRHRVFVPFSHPAWKPSDLIKDASTASQVSFSKFDPQVTVVRKFSGAMNLLLITAILVVAQQFDVLRGYEAIAWGMMLWLGIANAALLNNARSTVFKGLEIARSVVLVGCALQLSALWALATLPAVALTLGWMFLDGEAYEAADATS